MRRLLLTAVSVTATTGALAAIPAEVTIDSGTIAGTTGATADAGRDARGRATQGAVADRPSATAKAQILGDAVATESQTVPASATLAFFDSAYQQLLQGGANQ